MAELRSIVRQTQPTNTSALSEALAIDTGLAERLADVARAHRLEILSDHPAEEDALGVDALVRTLVEITLSDRTQTPLTIALDGEWGTGKTSILQLIERQARQLGFPCITLNAWGLESTENLITAVAGEIQREVDARPERQDFGRRVLDFAASMLAGVAPSLRTAVEATRTLRQREGDIVELGSIVTARRSFDELVQALLAEDGSRLIVFVDDVDRALPDQIATVLKNLKLILESKRCVFMLAMDMSVVARAIDEHYRAGRANLSFFNFRDVVNSNDVRISAPEGTESPEESFGLRYLEKLVQIRVPVPPLTRSIAGRYISRLGVIPDVQRIVEWAPDEDVLNPRRLKRYVNWLSISLQLLAAVERPPGVGQLTALAATALRHDHPEVYEALLSGRKAETLPLGGFVRRRRADSDTCGRFLAYLGSLPFRELQAFNDFVAANPILAAGVRITGLPAGDLMPVEGRENVAWDIWLRDPGDRKIQVIKAVREVTGLGLKEAKDLVDTSPSVVRRSASKAEAQKIKLQLEEAGATVSMEPFQLPNSARGA